MRAAKLRSSAATASQPPAVAGGKYENAQTSEDVCNKRESAAADNTSGCPTCYQAVLTSNYFLSNPQTSPAPNAMKIKNNISIGM